MSEIEICPERTKNWGIQAQGGGLWNSQVDGWGGGGGAGVSRAEYEGGTLDSMAYLSVVWNRIEGGGLLKRIAATSIIPYYDSHFGLRTQGGIELGESYFATTFGLGAAAFILKPPRSGGAYVLVGADYMLGAAVRNYEKDGVEFIHGPLFELVAGVSF